MEYYYNLFQEVIEYGSIEYYFNGGRILCEYKGDYFILLIISNENIWGPHLK